MSTAEERHLQRCYRRRRRRCCLRRWRARQPNSHTRRADVHREGWASSSGSKRGTTTIAAAAAAVEPSCRRQHRCRCRHCVVFWPRWWRLRVRRRGSAGPGWPPSSAARSRWSVTAHRQQRHRRAAGRGLVLRRGAASSPSSSSSLMPTPPRCAVAKRTRKRAERKRCERGAPCGPRGTLPFVGADDRSIEQASEQSEHRQSKKTKKFRE